MTNSSKNIPTAIIISELDDLAFCLCRQIANEKCLVKIICKDKKTWAFALKKEGLSQVEIVNVASAAKDLPVHYVIYHLNFFKLAARDFKKTEKREVGKISFALNLAGLNKAKVMLLLPSRKESLSLLEQYKKRRAESNLSSANAVFFGETLGHYYRTSPGIFGRMVREAAKKLPVAVFRPEVVLPLSSAASCAREVVRLLFSFGLKQGIVIEGTRTSSNEFFQKLLTYNPSLKSRQVAATPEPTFSAGQILLVDPPSDQDIFEALYPLEQNVGHITENKKILSDSQRNILYLVFSLLLFLTLPYLVLVVSGGLLFGGGALALRQNLSASRTFIEASGAASKASSQGFSLLSRLPLGNFLFGPGLTISNLVERTASTSLHAVSIIDGFGKVSENFFSKEAYDVSQVSEDLTLELDHVYRDLGFLQGEISTLGEKLPQFSGQEGLLEKMSKIRETISYAKILSQELPWILGNEQERTYLILFQNNMELRPTGGYIGSYAIVSVEKGRLTDIEIQDVFSADGQLKGHVEPPEPIKKYLGEAGWYLRDSNWDPEFSVSAQRAEWFLDKELNVSVDGVASLDLEAAKKFLDATGEIELVDYSKTISNKNLYAETRKEIEENFFPGSRAKQGILTALASSLLTKISEPGSIDKARLGRATLSALEERNIQVFIHNGPGLKALDGLGWTGSLPQEVCLSPCFGDWMGLAEANVGVNKANFYIERKVDLLIQLQEGQVKRTATITWRNNAPNSDEEKGRYEVYVRVLVPRGNFADGQKKMGQSIVGFSPDIEVVRGHIEAGTIVEVFPQEESSVIFSWTSPAEIPGEKGEYILMVRKQAGTLADPWEISIDNQLGKNASAEPVAFLTGRNTFRYNTILARDFVSRISW